MMWPECEADHLLMTGVSLYTKNRYDAREDVVAQAQVAGGANSASRWIYQQ
jgi:hypothetical protein